jgi:hypothetical protein
MMGYSEVLNLEATETTAGLRPGPDTTDDLLSIEASEHQIRVGAFVEVPHDASVATRDFPRH